MNHIIAAVILGIVQGIAEFLPISSSAHLIIFRDLLLINKINFISFLFIALLIFADIYLTEFFESVYDFIVKIIIKWKNKRSRVSNEK